MKSHCHDSARLCPVRSSAFHHRHGCDRCVRGLRSLRCACAHERSDQSAGRFGTCQPTSSFPVANPARAASAIENTAPGESACRGTGGGGAQIVADNSGGLRNRNADEHRGRQSFAAIHGRARGAPSAVDSGISGNTAHESHRASGIPVIAANATGPIVRAPPRTGACASSASPLIANDSRYRGSSGGARGADCRPVPTRHASGTFLRTATGSSWRGVGSRPSSDNDWLSACEALVRSARSDRTAPRGPSERRR